MADSDDIAKVKVEVTGPAMSPVSFELVADGDYFVGTYIGIPAGSDRVFVAKAYDSNNKLVFEGKAQSDVDADATSSVKIVMQEKVVAQDYNGAPSINSATASSSSVVPGEKVTLTVVATDPDGDAMTYAWTAGSGSFSDASVAKTTWTAPSTDGDVSIKVTVKDPDGKSDTVTIKVTVKAANATGNVAISGAINHWPTVLSVTTTAAELAVSGKATVKAVAADTDNDRLTYAWSDNCSGSFNRTNRAAVTWTAPATPVACTLTIKVSDGKGGSSSANLYINVGSTDSFNSAPLIDSVFASKTRVTRGGKVVLRSAATDPDGDTMTYSWSAVDGTFADSTKANTTWTAPAAKSTIKLVLTVTDAKGASTSKTVKVAVR